MGYKIDYDSMDKILIKLQEKYLIYAPKRRNAQNGDIRYGEIHSMREIVYTEKSNFSPKEVFYPIIQPLLYFKEGNCTESELDQDQDILIFARACDMNGIKRLDQMFLGNGGQADNFYQRRREKVTFILMECGTGWDTCFCVSMGTNVTADYVMAISFGEEQLNVAVKEVWFEKYFAGFQPTDYEPQFVTENKKSIRIPDIKERGQIKEIIGLNYWRQFDDKCISCGGCNTVCISCSCFDTVDVIYNETSMEGERRRVWSSCMLKSFTVMAGGHGVRPGAGERMRFKTLHKIYDYKLRFDSAGHMCVGCGRCDMRCPKDIHFSAVIDGLSEEVAMLNEKEGENK